MRSIFWPLLTIPSLSTANRSFGPDHGSLITTSPVPAIHGLKSARSAEHTGSVNLGICSHTTDALTGQAYCFPAVAADGTRQACRTLWDATTGCDVKTSPSTVAITSSAIGASCDQTSCGICLSTDLPLSTTVLTCTDYKTSNCTVFPAQATAFPSGSATTPVFISTLSITATITKSAGGVLARGTRPRQVEAQEGSENSIANDDFTSVNSSSKIGLRKRTMLLPESYGGIDSYMLTGVELARRSNNMAPYRGRSTGGRSSALFRPFRDQPFKMAMEGLMGCTGVLLMSRKGVWMSHHWESPTFTNNADPGSNTVDSDILVGMFQGDISGLYPGVNRYTATGIFNKARFGATDNIIETVIVTPVVHDFDFWSFDPNLGFPDDMNTWKWAPDIFKIWKILKDTFQIVPSVVNYSPVEGTNAQIQETWQTIAKGKILFEYDPKQWIVPAPDGNCQVQWAASRVHTAVGFPHDVVLYPGVGSLRIEDLYTEFIRITYGDLSWESNSTDNSKLPYCEVGG